MPRNIFALIFTILFCFSSIWAEDGSALWLRYASGAKAEITSKKQSPTLRIAVFELQNFWQGGISVTLEVRNNKELRALGNEGYTIQTSKGGNQITIASCGEQGVLYGTYHYSVCKLPDNYRNQLCNPSISLNDLIIEFVS